MKNSVLISHQTLAAPLFDHLISRGWTPAVNLWVASTSYGTFDFFRNPSFISNLHVALIHKDIGNIEDLLRALREKEGGNTVRIGIMSNELKYFHNRGSTCLEYITSDLRADFVMDTEKIDYSRPFPDWILKLIETGRIFPEEEKFRGDPDQLIFNQLKAEERLKLIRSLREGGSGNRERQ